MVLWLGSGAALLVLTLLLVLLLPISLSSSVQGRADPSGSWAVACGLGVGPIAFSVIAAAGVAPFVTCHVLGRQLAKLPLSRWRRRPKEREAKTTAPTADAKELPARLTRFERHVAAFFRSLDPLESLLSWIEHDGAVQLRSLVLEARYSFQDIALTGRILAGFYVLSAVLPEHWLINQTPSWESEDSVALEVDARFRIWLGRLLFDLARFVLKQRSLARLEPAAPATQPDERIKDR